MYKSLLFLGAWFDLKATAVHQVDELLEFLTDHKEVGKSLKIVATSGFDGSGQHAMWLNTPRNSETHNKILGGFRIIRIEDADTGEIYYQEESTGTDSEKGWFLEPGKETEAKVEELYEKVESEVRNLNTSFLVSSVKEDDVEIKTTVLGKDTKLQFDMSITQCDNKNFYHFCGEGSSFCKQCDVTAIEGNKKENIARGFPRTKTLETQKAKYAALLQHPKVLNGDEVKDIPAKERNGMLRPIMGEGDHGGSVPVNHVISPVHIIINTLNYEQNLGCHYNSRLEPGMNGIIPPRGPRKLRNRNAPENKALRDSTTNFKTECWKGPTRLRVGHADMTGCG